MKYWKEKESNPVESMQFWQGTTITKLAENEIFVMGTNPSGIHGAGAAKAGLKFGAKMLVGRGLMGSTYGLITKNLEGKAGFLEKETGIVYDKEGYCSVSTEQIRANIDEMYTVAKQPEHQNKKFLITYPYESWPNGTPKKSLNGYTSQEMLEMFAKNKDVPPNIVFHESYKQHLEKLYKNQNKQSNSKLVFFEYGKSIDIKEEDIIWTTDLDERNPKFVNGAGAANIALKFGAKYYSGRGIVGQTYGLVTKNLHPNFYEASTGITYHKVGEKSVSESQIKANILELYETARNHADKRFLIAYTYDSRNLNGYSSQDMVEMFASSDIPENIVFHESFIPHIKKAQKLRQENMEKNNLKFEEPKTPIYVDTNKYEYFFGGEGEYSNFYPSAFTFRNKQFISNEHFFMYSKAKLFGDEEQVKKLENFLNYPLVQELVNKRITSQEIVSNKDVFKNWKAIQMSIKAAGRAVKNYNDDVWNAKRFEIMSEGLYQKFSQNDILKERLLKTGDKFLVEASPYDDIWGIKLDERRARLSHPSLWPGKNLLGIALTYVRERLVNDIQNNKGNALKESQKEIQTNQNPSGILVANFYALNKTIPEDGLYIGRANAKFGLPQSLFANPFPVINPEDRDKSIQDYRKWLWNKILDNVITKDDLKALVNKKIVCYCKPKNCHGDVLQSVVNYLLSNEAEFDQKVEEGRQRKAALKDSREQEITSRNVYSAKNRM